VNREAPEALSDDVERVGGGRYAVFESIGLLYQGSLHALWDTRLRMWRTGLRCDPAQRAALQHTARVAEDIRRDALLRTRDVLDDWVVLEAVNATPLVLDTPWPAGAVRDAVHTLGKALQALRDQGLEPGALLAHHLLATDDHRLLLVPPACTDVVDPQGAEAATALSMLMAGLVQGAPVETAYDDVSLLPPGLAAAHALATGHKPELSELVRALEQYDAYAEDATDARREETDDGSPVSRVEQMSTATERPSYVADDVDVAPGDEMRRLEEARTAALAAAKAEAKAPVAPVAAAGAAAGGLVFLAVAAVALVVGLPLAAVGYGAMDVRSAQTDCRTTDMELGEILELEIGARDELEALGIASEPLALARVAGPIHEGQALLAALEATDKPPLSDRPEARVLHQRRDRIAPVFADAVRARATWRDLAEQPLGAAAVAVGAAPAYEPIPSIEHLMP